MQRAGNSYVSDESAPEAREEGAVREMMQGSRGGAVLLYILLAGCVPSTVQGPSEDGSLADGRDTLFVDGEDEGQTDVLSHGDAEEGTGDSDVGSDTCPVCGEVCEGAVATCGQSCCPSRWDPYGSLPERCLPEDVGPSDLLQGDEGWLTRLQFRQVPVTVTADNVGTLPSLPGWSYRANGTEVFFVAVWVDCWGYWGSPTDTSSCGWGVGCCAHHCWVDLTTHYYVVDIQRDALLYAHAVGTGDPAWEYEAGSRSDRCLLQEAAFCVELPGRDATYLAGGYDSSDSGSVWWPAGQYIGVWPLDSLVAGGPRRLSELPRLQSAINVFETSSGAFLWGIDLVVLLPGESWVVPRPDAAGRPGPPAGGFPPWSSRRR